MDTKLTKLLEKSVLSTAAGPVTDAMCGEIAHHLANECNYLISVPTGPERVSLAVGILGKMLSEHSPVWYVCPSEMLAVNQKFHFASAFSDASGVALIAMSKRESRDARLLVWSAEMLLNAMAEWADLPKPALLVIDHGDLLNHPVFGSMLESILLSFPLDIPLLMFTSPTDDPDVLTGHMLRSRRRACRYLESSQAGRSIIPAFLSTDWELSVLTDKRRLAGKVKRVMKSEAGFRDVRFPDFINRLASLLREEKLTPALVLLPSEEQCDLAADCCRIIRQDAGSILTAASVSAMLGSHPLLKEDPLLNNALSRAAASFHKGHCLVWLQLAGKLLALNGIDLLFTTPDSVSDLDHRMAAAVICMLAERRDQRPPACAHWQIEWVKGLLGRERAGVFTLAHTPDCDPVRVKDQLTDSRVAVASGLGCTSRIVLSLLTASEKKAFPAPVNCSLFAAQHPSGPHFSDRQVTEAGISFAELDADLKEQLPEARCAAYLHTVHALIEMHARFSIRSGQLGLKKGGDAKREVEALEALISRFPCQQCPHFSMCHKRGSKRLRSILSQYDEVVARNAWDAEALGTDFSRHLECVQAFGLADANERPTPAGRFALCTGLSHPQPLVECFRQSILTLLDPDILFAWVSGFCLEDMAPPAAVPEEAMPFFRQVEKVYTHMEPILNRVQEGMLRFGLLPPAYSLSDAAMMLARNKGADVSKSEISDGFRQGRMERLTHHSACLVELIRTRGHWLA